MRCVHTHAPPLVRAAVFLRNPKAIPVRVRAGNDVDIYSKMENITIDLSSYSESRFFEVKVGK